jgi:hypothetical protein
VVKELFTKAPILQLPNIKLPFEVSCDASQSSIGGVLNQNRHPIAFSLKILMIIERDILPMIWNYIQQSNHSSIDNITLFTKSLFYSLIMIL